MCDTHDVPTVYSERVFRSRKVRKCCECRTPIVVGERYQSVFGIWNGNVETYQTCLACAALRDEMERVDMCPLFEGLDDAVCNVDDRTDEIDAFWARREAAQAQRFGVMSIRPPRDLQPMEIDPW